MQKLNQKTEEAILIALALMVLFSSMFNPTVSAVIAVVGLIGVFSYNILTKGK